MSRFGTAYHVSRAAGDWQSSNDHLIPEISNLHRCTSDGQDIYLAGVEEESRPGHGGGPELIQTLVAVRLSVQDFSRTVLVKEEQHQLETDVEDLTGGPGWVGVVLRDGQTKQHALRIYRTSSSPGAVRVVYDKTSSSALTALWVSKDLAVSWDRTEAKFVALP